MITLVRWPLMAMLFWGGSWLLYLVLSNLTAYPVGAMLLVTVAGVLLSALARRLGMSTARAVALAVGFPVSLWFVGVASIPAWAWLLPLVLVAWVYPVRAWRDAPVFPTPLHALKALSALACVPAHAHVLDAGCGAGDGLRALRLAYPQARLTGIEFSRPLSWVARLRCPWAQVHCGDIWEDHWGAYDLVYLFQRPETMPRAVAKAKAEMKPGAWLVSLEFEAREIQPTAVAEASPGRPLWLYQLPFSS